MQRATGPTAIDIGGGRLGYRDENLGSGIEGTELRAGAVNNIQEELASGLVEFAGLVLDGNDWEQVRKALSRLFGGGNSLVNATGALTADAAGLVRVDASGGALTITLPAANAAGGRPQRFLFVRTDSSANAVTVQRAGADTIEGGNTLPLPANGRLVLMSDGATAWRVVGGSTGRLIGVQVFAASGTYTPTPGTQSVLVELIGGGGGGGGAQSTASGEVAVASGAASGSYARGRFTSGFAGAAVTIGAAGTGGTGAAGTDGGASSFGGLMTAPGGPGGGISKNPPPWVQGSGQAALPTGGNIEAAQGASGGVSFMAGLGGNSGYGGPGAASRMGGGGRDVSANSNGTNAGSPGAGGGGTANAESQATARTGGNGAPGRCIVWEFA